MRHSPQLKDQITRRLRDEDGPISVFCDSPHEAQCLRRALYHWLDRKGMSATMECRGSVIWIRPVDGTAVRGITKGIAMPQNQP